MATLTELQSLLGDPALKDKVKAAVVKTAVSVAFEAPETANHAGRLAWAKGALDDPNGTAEKVTRYVVAATTPTRRRGTCPAWTEGSKCTPPSPWYASRTRPAST